jgi:hypothetical protein
MEGKMKKILTERFQQLAGIKSLYEQPEDDDFERDDKNIHPTEVFTDEELKIVSDMLIVMLKKLNINTDLQTDTQEDQNKVDALFKFIDGYFETLGGTY